jgi:hypothetical protein
LGRWSPFFLSQLQADSNPQPSLTMNNMLELSKYADYDFFAALAIIGLALLAKFWEPLRNRLG